MTEKEKGEDDDDDDDDGWEDGFPRHLPPRVEKKKLNG